MAHYCCVPATFLGSPMEFRTPGFHQTQPPLFSLWREWVEDLSVWRSNTHTHNVHMHEALETKSPHPFHCWDFTSQLWHLNFSGFSSPSPSSSTTPSRSVLPYAIASVGLSTWDAIPLSHLNGTWNNYMENSRSNNSQALSSLSCTQYMLWFWFIVNYGYY